MSYTDIKGITSMRDWPVARRFVVSQVPGPVSRKGRGEDAGPQNCVKRDLFSRETGKKGVFRILCLLMSTEGWLVKLYIVSLALITTPHEAGFAG
jgi:hypothetical protein